MLNKKTEVLERFIKIWLLCQFVFRGFVKFSEGAVACKIYFAI